MKTTLALFFMLCTTLLLAKPNVIVSITPQKTFVDKIAKDMVTITTMVPPGSSPHGYEPKPSQMVALSKADIYFSMGVEFDKVWSDKLRAQNENLKFVDLSAKIKKLPSAKKHHHHDSHGHKESHNQRMDPHTWLTPKNVKIMAQTIYEHLVEVSPENTDIYTKNLNAFLEEIEATDTQIRSLLKDVPSQAKFMAFHPAWGYFANEYDLEQIAIEVEGKSPGPKEIIKIIEEAKEAKVRVIFTQPEFSDKSTRIIAKEANIKVEKISPLNPQWSQNLIKLAQTIAKR